MDQDPILLRLNQRFDQVDVRFDKVDARFEQVDARFDQVDARFERLERKVDQQGEDLRRHMQVVTDAVRDDIRILAEAVAHTHSRLENFDLRPQRLEGGAG